MPKTLLLLLCSLPLLLNAAEVHDHTGHTTAQSAPPVMEHAGTEDLITSINFERLEWQKNPEGEAHLAWDFASYVGNDNSRWWLKSEGAASETNTEEAYVQLAYSQPVSPFWDLQLGLHSQLETEQENTLMVGMFGLAPWFVHINSYLLLNSNGHVIWHLEADYDIKLTQNWVLLLDGELKANARNNAQTLSGSGLSESEFSVRLAYERLRKLVPYVGIEWERSYGNTRDYREQAGEHGTEWQGVAGLKLWY
jgi:copper resistance protein B